MEKATDSSEEVTPNKGIMVFTASLVRQLSAPGSRLEPTYVGVRRVRPSSRLVKEAFVNSNKTNSEGENGNESGHKYSALSFKVVGEDGVERRMTNQEKKALKLQIAQQKKHEKELRRLEREQNEPTPTKRGKKRKCNEKRPDETEDLDENPKENTSDDEDSIGAALAKVGVAQQKLSFIEQEIADLKGERQGVPPVILPPPLAQVAMQTPRFLPGNTSSISQSTCSTSIWMDDNLAKEWAEVLTQSMAPALEVREQEDMRSLVYDIVPEPWQRLRPDTIQAGLQPPPIVDDIKAESGSTEESLLVDNRESWEFVAIRPPAMSTFDSDMAIVADVLHRNTALYLSCGAKFGSDFLVYDGPRIDRHAFAGLRVINETGGTYAATSSNSASDRTFPVPCLYGMAGYVRCLNTAGKLALIAMVKREEGADGSPQCRVAIVDLKLERVDGTKRKDMGERLQKLHRS